MKKKTGKFRVGVVGVGRLGSEHARVYSKLGNVELTAVADTDGKKAGDIAAKYKTVPCGDYRMLADKVDAVSIAVPTEGHYETARFFLERGIDVLIEKPITRTLSEADELIALSEKQGLLLQVGHIERFNSALNEAGKTIENPGFIECHRLSPYQPRGTDVSVILDLMIHDIDIILSLVQSEIENIQAVGVSVLTPDVDIANARILFQNGAVANITSSRVSREKLRKIRVFSKNTYVSIDCISQKMVVCRKEGGKIAVEELSADKKEPLDLELRHFIECVSERKEPVVSGRSAREALRVALEIAEKIKTHS